MGTNWLNSNATDSGVVLVAVHCAFCMNGDASRPHTHMGIWEKQKRMIQTLPTKLKPWKLTRKFRQQHISLMNLMKHYIHQKFNCKLATTKKREYISQTLDLRRESVVRGSSFNRLRVLKILNFCCISNLFSIHILGKRSKISQIFY